MWLDVAALTSCAHDKVRTANHNAEAAKLAWSLSIAFLTDALQ
jgi:hypothetical protein